jgi:hypothetical protein
MYPTKKGSDGASTGNEQVIATQEKSDCGHTSSKSISDGQLQGSAPSGKSDIDPGSSRPSNSQSND